MSNSYFERNKCNDNNGNDIYQDNTVGTFTDCYSTSSNTQHFSISSAFTSLPTLFTINDPILVDVGGKNSYSCFYSANSKCRSISFSCLANFFNGDYNIQVGEGTFVENVIKACADKKSLNIEGSGTAVTFIVGNIYLNDNNEDYETYTLNSHTSLFYSSFSNSLTVRLLTIYISDGTRNVFKHESTGSLLVEDIIIKPLNLFLGSKMNIDCGIFLLNSAPTTINSVSVEEITLNNEAVFEFINFPSSFSFHYNSFSSIEKTGTFGGSVLAFAVPDDKIIELVGCKVAYIFYWFCLSLLCIYSSLAVR
jgi:hypothetical protein